MYNLIDNIKFNGYLIDTNGQAVEPTPIIKYIASLINIYPKYDSSYYLPEYNPISDEILKIKWIIGSSSTLNAWTIPKINEIGINLFTMSSIISMPNLSHIINEFFMREIVTIDEIKIYIKNTIKESYNDINNLFNIWSRNILPENNYIRWNFSEFCQIKNEFFFEDIFRFIMWHELSHWNLFKFKDDKKNMILGQTKKHLGEFLNCNMLDDKDLKIVKEYLSKKNIYNSWIEEITADTMSIISAIKLVEFNAKKKQRVYSSLAVAFGLMKYFETFSCYYYNSELTYTTHPPVKFREQILMYILSKENNLTITQFIEYQYGSALVMQVYLEQLLQNVL